MIKASKKKLLVQFVNSKCELCHKEFPMLELHIHRIHRGYQGGSYDDFRNLKVLCKTCHKLLHSNEFK